jgi:cytochrome P450
MLMAPDPPPPQGFETTSHAISWTLAALAAYPDCQERLARELAAAGLAPTPEHPVPRDFEWSDMARLPYLGAVVKETLRLFSPASLGTTRLTDRPVEVGEDGQVFRNAEHAVASPGAATRLPHCFLGLQACWTPRRLMPRSPPCLRYARPI